MGFFFFKYIHLKNSHDYSKMLAMKRSFFLLLFFLPFALTAQFKRSATELAKENAQEYLADKVFKSQAYQSISYGELRARRERDRGIAWSIEHTFRIIENEVHDARKTPVQKIHRFIFYFDNKMRVLGATSLFE
jgi:hypothetical protein